MLLDDNKISGITSQVNTKLDMLEKWEYNKTCNEPNFAFIHMALLLTHPPTMEQDVNNTPTLTCLGLLVQIVLL